MDVLEHLPDPLATLRRVAGLLSPGGQVLVQTPRHDPALPHQALVAAQDPFLQQLKPGEHLLFSPASATALFREAGLSHVRFEHAVFAHYDMSFVASAAPVPEVAEDVWRAALRRSRTGRVAEALADAYDRAVRAEAARAAAANAATAAASASAAREARGAAEQAALAGRVEEAEALATHRQDAVHLLATELARARAERDALAREKAAVLRRLGPFASLIQRGIARS